MVLLEARAQKIAEEEGGFKPVVGNSQIRFVRGEGQTTKDDTAENPDEINIEDDEDDGKQILKQFSSHYPFAYARRRLHVIFNVLQMSKCERYRLLY